MIEQSEAHVSASNPENHSHHRIKSVSIVGGFLDGQKFEFTDGLNCFIGARGTGKTTVLELAGFALDNLPSREHAADQRKRIEGLVKQNLGGGRVQVAIETKDGLSYTVSRSWGEDAIVLTADGEPTEITLKSGGVFKADFYSQNEVESIADRPLFQLDLIDNFAAGRIAEIEGSLKQVQVSLAANAHQIAPLESGIAALTEELGTLPGIEEKLKKFTTQVGADAAEINEAHRLKALRDREQRSVRTADEILSAVNESLGQLIGRIEGQASSLTDEELFAGPNGALLRTAFDHLAQCSADVDEILNQARRRIVAERQRLSDATGQLSGRHKEQELAFRAIVEKHQHVQKETAERTELEKRRNELLAKRRSRDEKTKTLERLRQERTDLLDKISELRDQRFAIRKEVADRINTSLSPTIRVTVIQYGNPECYQRLLESALKGAGVKQGIVAHKLVNALWPAELSKLVRERDANALVDRAELNVDQAEKVIVGLSHSDALFDLETVELIDLPRIELKDGEEYKDAGALSTGQKCTTILPILLLDSDNPLLIDQPEDNLDNRFIFETVVESIRRVKQHRQLVFVTHNPNIPVLGDADRVFVLESDGAHARKANEGTVDECKDEIVTLLEGGEEAFKRRKARYEY